MKSKCYIFNKNLWLFKNRFLSYKVDGDILYISGNTELKADFSDGTNVTRLIMQKNITSTRKESVSAEVLQEDIWLHVPHWWPMQKFLSDIQEYMTWVQHKSSRRNPLKKWQTTLKDLTLRFLKRLHL